jgi:hypothetical protein
MALTEFTVEVRRAGVETPDARHYTYALGTRAHGSTSPVLDGGRTWPCSPAAGSCSPQSTQVSCAELVEQATTVHRTLAAVLRAVSAKTGGLRARSCAALTSRRHVARSLVGPHRAV